MEKTVWLFHRHPDRDRANFQNHYLTSHAPYGKKLTRCLLGYTVNLVESDYPGGPDSVTEHWVDRATDLFDQAIAYATPEDAQTVLLDDRTLFEGWAFPHIVVDETEVVAGAPNDTPLEQATPGAKLIWMYQRADDAPPPPEGASRVVDSVIDRRLGYSERGIEVLRPLYRLMRTAWVDDVASVGDAAVGALVATEYRYVDPPQWR